VVDRSGEQPVPAFAHALSLAFLRLSPSKAR
jgi:hypothetical protein